MNLRSAFHKACDLGAAQGGMGLGGARPQNLSPGAYLDLRKASSSGSCTVGRKLPVRRMIGSIREKNYQSSVDTESLPMTGHDLSQPIN